MPRLIYIAFLLACMGATAVRVTVHFDDGTTQDFFPAAAPVTQPTTAADVLVGPTRPHQTLASAIAAAQPGNTIELDAGTYAGGVVVNKSVTIAAAPGATVIIQANPTGNYPSILDIRGEEVVLDGLEFDANGNATARAIRAAGKNTTVRNCHPAQGTNLRWFVEAVGGCDGLLLDKCGRDKQTTQRYFLYAGGNTKNITVRDCIAGARIEHVIRIHGTIGMRIERCDLDGSGCRSVLNFRDGSDFVAERNKLAGAGIIVEPLGDGNGLRPDGTPVDATVMAKRLRNVTIRDNDITGRTNEPYVVNAGMGLDGLTLENNRVTMSVPTFVNVHIDDRYAQRGRPANIRILDNKITTTAQNPALVKGATDGIAAHGGNTINGSNVD